jgi:hypothetical protein
VQMVTASGCNITLRGDIVRRSIICRLDAQTERPELRDIDQDLIAEVRERRRDLVADMITVMLAYPAGWAPRYRSLAPGWLWGMVTHGAPGACLGWRVRPMRGDGADPGWRSIAAELGLGPRSLARRIGQDAMTAAEAVERAARDGGLREALAVICEKCGELDSRGVGY